MGDPRDLVPGAIGLRRAQLLDELGQRTLVGDQHALDQLRLAVRIEGSQLGHAGGVQHGLCRRAFGAGVVQVDHRTLRFIPSSSILAL